LRNDIEIGQIIDIPIKTSIENAIVLDIIKEDEITISKDKIKSIIDIVIKKPLLQDYQIKLIKYIANNYFSSIHNSVNLFLPKNIREKIKKNKLTEKKEKVFNYTYLEKKDLSIGQKKVYEQIISTSKNKILLY
jgi:primosomal protein N'